MLCAWLEEHAPGVRWAAGMVNQDPPVWSLTGGVLLTVLQPEADLPRVAVFVDDTRFRFFRVRDMADLGRTLGDLGGEA